MGAFVGEERQRIVADLMERYLDVKYGRGVQVVVLASPPGWGKTRIVQEFYARLSAAQPEPAYWPPSIEAIDGPDMKSVLDGRKRVYPTEVVVPAGAQMPWLWWGVLCHERSNGVFAQALFDDVTQVWSHAEGIVTSNADASGRAFDATGAVVSLAGLLGIAAAPPVGVALAVGGAARTGWMNRDLTDRLRKWKERRGQRSIQSADYGRTDQVAEIAEQLAQVARKAPVVIVVDDAHVADSTLIGVLDHLITSTPTARVLVIATAWPQSIGPGQPRPFAAWMSDTEQSRVTRFDLVQLENEAAQALALDDLGEVIGDAGPAASTTIAAQIVGRAAGNPLGIRALLRLPRVRAAMKSESLTKADLDHLPRKLEDLFSDYFDDLPDGVQQVLARAADLGGTYLPTVVIAAALADGIDSAADDAENAINPYGWVRALDDTLHTFVDPLLVDAARRGGEDLFTPRQRRHLHEQVVATAVATNEAGASGTTAQVIWTQHVNLAREGLVRGDQAATGSALRLANRLASRYAYSDAITLANDALTWTEVGPDHPDTLTIRSNLAHWYGEAGRVDDAIEAFQALLTDRLRVLGPNHPITLTTRNNLAYLYGEAGRVDDAIEALQALLTDQTRVLGPDHPDTLATRNNLAYLYGEAGRVDDAIEAFQAVLADRLRVLGPDHPDALATRSNLVTVGGRVGRADDTIEALQALLTDRLRVLGPDHPDTLTTRSSLAYSYGLAGRVDDAIEAFQAVLADQLRVLGSDHPKTHTTRSNLASWYGRAGRADDTIEAFQALLTDQLRVLGPNHRKTLATRSNLASWYGRAGYFDDAIEALQALLADQLMVVGPNHPDTLTIRSNLAYFSGRAGRVDDAIAAFQALLTDQLRVLGPNQRDTLTTRSNLASWYGLAGRVGDALEAFQALLADQLRVLGPDHPDSLTTRYSLIAGQFVAGRVTVERTVEALEVLAADCVRALDPRHEAARRVEAKLQELRGRQEGAQ